MSSGCERHPGKVAFMIAVITGMSDLTHAEAAKVSRRQRNNCLKDTSGTFCAADLQGVRTARLFRK